MQTNFNIETQQRDGDLHVQTRGDFNGSSAMQLIHTLHEKYNGRGKVFIETNHLREICPFGCRTFQCRLDKHKLPVERLYFKGQKGLEMAPEGSTVIASSHKDGCGCNGNCRNCPCSKKDKQLNKNYNVGGEVLQPANLPAN